MVTYSPTLKPVESWEKKKKKTGEGEWVLGVETVK